MTRSLRPARMLAAALVAGAAVPVLTAAPDGAAGQSSAHPLFLIAPPAASKGVAEAKKEARTGQRIVLQGKIGGSENPFTDKRAVFTIVDLKLKSCDQIPGDECPVPWDYCCEPTPSIAAHAATIQIVDEHGRVRREGVKGTHGLEPLRVVTVAGTVHRTDNKALLIVNADQVHVEGGPGDAPDALFLETRPENAAALESLTSGKPGDKVTVKGFIPSNENAFDPENATFRLTDSAGDSATVRVVDASGAPLPASARFSHGLDSGANVVIVGTIADRAGSSQPTIDATGIWIEPASTNQAVP